VCAENQHQFGVWWQPRVLKVCEAVNGVCDLTSISSEAGKRAARPRIGQKAMHIEMWLKNTSSKVPGCCWAELDRPTWMDVTILPRFYFGHVAKPGVTQG